MRDYIIELVEEHVAESVYTATFVHKVEQVFIDCVRNSPTAIEATDVLERKYDALDADEWNSVIDWIIGFYA